MSSKRIFQFDEFTLDATDRLLYRSGETVRIPPKLLDTLILLVERRGSIVTKDEIMLSVWPHTVVEEGGLARNISLLRKSLGEEDGSRYIETIPKRGYRFVGEIREPGGPSEQPISTAAPARISSFRIIIAALVLIEAAAAIFVWWQRHAVPEFQTVALTTNAPELPVISAAISPDGKYLAYSDSSGLYVRPMGSSEIQRINTPPGALANFLDWFPDNVHLLVSGFDEREQKSTVWSISVLGGESKTLYTDAISAAVSPDGSRIAFISHYNQIWLAQADGNSPRVFAALPDTDFFLTRVQFSPDGEYLLDQHSAGGSTRMMVEARRLQDGKVATLFDINGTIIDFLLLQNGELWVSHEIADNDVSTRLVKRKVDIPAEKTGPLQTVADWPDLWTYWLSATRDGKQIAMIKDRTQSDVYVADLAPSGTTISNIRRLTLDDSMDRPSAWLPDNHTVLFHSKRTNTFGIYRQSIDQQRAEVVVSDGHDNFWPVVSPDQKWLLYLAGPNQPDTQTDVVRQPILGGPPEVVDSKYPGPHSLRCPQRGPYCVLLERDAQDQVFYEFDPIAGRGRELARMEWSPLNGFDWSVSPDGRQIAAVVPRNVRNTIALFSLGTGQATRRDIIVPGYQALRSLFWDAKGQGFYVSNYTQFAGVYLHVSLDGKAVVLHRVINNAEGWAIPSPDGRHLAFQEWTLGGNVWLMERH